MGLIETVREHKLAVAAIGVLAVIVVVAVVGVSIAIPGLIQFLETQTESAGDVTIDKVESDVVAIRVTAMNKSDYMNVVVNGGTDEPRPGITVQEAESLSATPAEQIGTVDLDDPMSGPPDVDADSVGDLVLVRGVRSGDTISVVGVRSSGSSTTRVLFRSYTV